MPTTRIAAGLIAISTIISAPAFAADPRAPLCSPTVSAALTAWDTGLVAAGKFGDKAVGLAREKGREYLAPLLGMDSKTVPGQDDQTTAISRALEATRQDPQQRLDLCIAVTETIEQAKGSAKAGWEALQRATERFAPAPQKPTPADDRGFIKT